MDKREMIERALDSYLDELDWNAFGLETAEFFSALADQAIVIECEVEHGKTESGFGMTDVPIQARPSLGSPYRWVIRSVEGHWGTPGKALAIIIALEKKPE